METAKLNENETLMRVQRDINCLLDQDRTTRRNALIALKQKLFSADVEKEHGKFVFEQHLLKNLVYSICDEIDFVREKALKLSEECLQKFGPISSESATKLLEVLLGRINAIPYPETSEEVRLLIVIQLKILLKDYKDAFRSCMHQASDVVAKILLDKYPDVKREAAELVGLFCSQMPEQIGLNAKSIVKSLALNAKHQHSKIRRITFDHGGENYPEAEQAIKNGLLDKSSDVRKEIYKLLTACLQKFSYPDLKTFEIKLVRNLLSGLSEQSKELRDTVTQELNCCGEARKALEEEMKGLA